MKTPLLLIALLWQALSIECLHAQQQLSGQVSNPRGEPLPGASIRLLKQGRVLRPDAAGSFRLVLPTTTDTLLITHVGYLPERLPIGPDSKGPLKVRLQPDENTLQEVEVNTGYYSVPKERATGSFTHIDNQLLNRSVSTNILDRLEGVTNSLLFDRRNLEGEDVNGTPELRVRGISTIESDSRPLVVIDNFPFEGDISSINPNDVQEVTILKDAAAASIWGARAGNGVIVITTKQGHYNQPAQISFTSNVNITSKPGLFYSQHYLPSPTVMEIQKELFERGAYQEQDQTYIPGYVELLVKKRDGEISDEDFAAQEKYMQQTDLRQQSLDYLYQPAINQQYALNIRGGGGNYTYTLSGGYDRDRANTIGNTNDRATIGIQNAYKVRPNLEITGSFYYTRQNAASNGIGYNHSASIYEALLDENGQPRSIFSSYRSRYQQAAPDNGLLDWMDRPLEERNLEDHRSKNQDMRFNGGVNYSFLKGFNLSATYQYTMGTASSQDFYDKDSYYVRNLVNRFTQADLKQVIPDNAIMDYNLSGQASTHSGRAQLNYHKAIGRRHDISALAGAEIRQAIGQTMPGSRIYNFDKDLWTGGANYDYVTRYDTRPSGRTAIPTNTGIPNKTLNRNLSYFANSSYSYLRRYILSGSIRWDGSNLLGVKSNQRGTALWSLGGSWELSKETFYQANWLPYLRLRATYGSAGNIDKSQSHYPTITVGTNTVTQLPQSTLTSPGNPSLRWEQVNTLNFGLDWRSKDQRITGSLEYYNKQASHLLGENLMDPTTGVGLNSGYKMNYADMQTTGWDVEISSRNLTGAFTWNSTLLLSHSENKVTRFNAPSIANLNQYLVSGNPVRQGQSVDLIYAHPWKGLNPVTGYPLIYVNGEASSDYKGYYSGLTPDNLLVAGVRVPPLFGSLRNTWTWNNIELSCLLSFKFGYVFRRTSISPGEEYLANPVYDMDYFKRWQKPGDELHTDVPAWAENYGDYERDYLYKYSEALITKGDAIRLQDISLGYTLDKRAITGLPFQSLKIYGYARNLGILWRANKEGIDPDYPNADYPAPRSFALGLQATF